MRQLFGWKGFVASGFCCGASSAVMPAGGATPVARPAPNARTQPVTPAVRPRELVNLGEGMRYDPNTGDVCGNLKLNARRVVTRTYTEYVNAGSPWRIPLADFRDLGPDQLRERIQEQALEDTSELDWDCYEDGDTHDCRYEDTEEVECDMGDRDQTTIVGYVQDRLVANLGQALVDEARHEGEEDDDDDDDDDDE